MLVGVFTMEYKRKFAIICLLLCILLCLFVAPAYANDTISHHEMVIILDISTSMGWVDSELLIPDGLRQFIAILPLFWHVGLVTFNTDVVDVVPPSENSRATINDILSHTVYSGATNTGAGLLQATELFSENPLSRNIIFATDDGDIWMPTATAITQARELLALTTDRIVDYEIPVHIVAIGNDFQNYENILILSRLTEGLLIQTSYATELSNIFSELAFNTFNVNSQLVGAAYLTDSRGSITIPLPDTRMDFARVLLTAENTISNVSVSGTGGHIEVQQGQRFAVIEIRNPETQEFLIEFTTTGAVNAELILEWLVSPEITVAYIDTPQYRTEIIDDLQRTTHYTSRTAQVKVALLNSEGENLLYNSRFQTFPIYVDGIRTQGYIRNGYIHWETDLTNITTNTSHDIRLNLDYFKINTLSTLVEFTITLYAPPPPTITEELIAPFDPRVLIATIAVLLIIVAIILPLYFRKKEKPPAPLPTPVSENKFEFTGKLNLYVTHTPEDLDIPPQIFDLFRLNSKREITLKTILDKCGIDEGFSGAEMIRFIASGQGNIQVAHSSSCTILVGQEILTKKQKHTLSYGMKIHVTFEDEISEMEIHYKSVKPSEKKILANPYIKYYD